MSLKEIAKIAGTSVSTVSRVLNSPDHRCNKNGLSEKIWQIANELEYVPNTSARNLRKGTPKKNKPFTIDVLLTRFDSLSKDEFFNELFQNAKEEFMKNECLAGEVLSFTDIISLTKTEIKPQMIPYRSSMQIITENAAAMSLSVSCKNNTGLLILGKCPSEIIPLLKKRYLYIVGIDRNPTEFKYDEVICNGITAADKAVEYLIALGHKNIAYIGDCTYESRYTGYYQALLRHRIPLSYENVYQSDQTRQEGYRIMHEIIEKSVRPTAVFCANDSTALGVLQALKSNKKRGYSPSVISIDNIAESEKTVPMLTTIDIPKKEMVHLAVTLLIDRKRNLHRENIRIELPCRLIERESCNIVYN